MIKQFMAALVKSTRAVVLLTLVSITYAIGLFGLFSIKNNPNDKSIGPYQDFVVDDVSKPQTFTIPAEFIPPVKIRYRLEGVLDDSASVTFYTDSYKYGYAKMKGVVADSAVHDFYEKSNMLISYEPRGVKKGHLVIKASIN